MTEGITRCSTVKDVLRDNLKKWKRDIRKYYGDTCPISGLKKNDTIVHHLKSLRDIFHEVAEEYGLPSYFTTAFVIDFSKHPEFRDFIFEIIKRHDINTGILISRQIHNQFHAEYKCGNNTPEQFNKFLMDHFNMSLYEIQRKYATKES